MIALRRAAVRSLKPSGKVKKAVCLLRDSELKMSEELTQNNRLILKGRKLSPRLLITYLGFFPDRLEGGDYNNGFYIKLWVEEVTSDTH